MSNNSAFFDQIGTIGAIISNQIAPALGITAQYQHGSASPVTIQGFIKNTIITKELILSVIAGTQKIVFFFAQQTGFPASGADITPIVDSIIWTPIITNTQLNMTIDTVENAGSNGTMYVLTCKYSGGIQVGAVGFSG